MKRRRHTPEQIIRKLAEGDKLLAEGKSIDEVCRHLEITESTWHRWRNQFGGMKAEDAKELKELQRENQRLKKIVADQALDIEMLKELNRKNGDPERSTPGGAMPERRLRGLRTTCLSAARPAPVHPTSCPTGSRRRRARPASVPAATSRSVVPAGVGGGRPERPEMPGGG